MAFSLKPSEHCNHLLEQTLEFAKKVKIVEDLDAQDQAHFEKEKKLLENIQKILQEMQEKATFLQQARKALHEKIKTYKEQLQDKLNDCDKDRINNMLAALFEAKKQTDALMETLEKSNRNLLLVCQIKRSQLPK